MRSAARRRLVLAPGALAGAAVVAVLLADTAGPEPWALPAATPPRLALVLLAVGATAGAWFATIAAPLIRRIRQQVAGWWLVLVVLALVIRLYGGLIQETMDDRQTGASEETAQATDPSARR
jgi:hypothetical protein